MDQILEKLRAYNEHFDFDRLRKVFSFVRGKYTALNLNESTSARILELILPFHPDEDTVCAVFLHKLHADGFLDENEIKSLFGDKVLEMLVAVKNLEALNYEQNDETAQMEILKKMFLAMARDIRVILVYLACRLYRMKKLEKTVLDKDKRRLFAEETMNISVSIAGRLGLYNMKSELEDLSFRYLNPSEYSRIVGQLEKLRNSCEISIEFVKNQLDKFLRDRGISAEVFGRMKNVYSIYKKLHESGYRSINDIYDVFAMRIILPAERDKSGNEVLDHLYIVLGLIHTEWKPISKKFKDYIAVPKPNGYRSLHTVVLGLAPKDANQPVEIQIRDSEMHKFAEYGIAAHWAYKEFSSKAQENWARGLERIRSEFGFDNEIVKEVEVDIFKDRIFVLTPRGEIKDLPRGACPIDFAYIVHTDIGNRCVMAKVNGNVVPLNYELKNGDVVEILTRKDAAPKLQWLSVVKTGFAKNKIKAWFSVLNRDENIKEGKKLLNAQLERIGKVGLDQSYSVLKDYLKRNLSFTKREALVEEVGRGAKLASDVIRKIFPYEKAIARKVVVKKPSRNVFVPIDEKVALEKHVLIGGESGLPIKMAACCDPKYGDDIVGYVTRMSRVTVHKFSCVLLNSLNAERVIVANWRRASGSEPEYKYFVPIKVFGVDRIGLLSDVTSVFSKCGVFIRDVSLKKTKNGFAEGKFLIEFFGLDQFDLILDKLSEVAGIIKVSKDGSFKSKVL